MREKLSGLYAITPAQETDTAELLRKAALSLQGGARLIQYRDKSDDHARRRDAALALRELTQRYNALLIINDDVALAASIGADGVHLGREDADPVTARKQLGDGVVIGVSCYNQFSRAAQAAALGADYVAFGRFFPSRTKPDAVQADIAHLRQARVELQIPVAAIGGINAGNARHLVQAGADMLAVVDAVFGAEDITAATRELAQLMSPETVPPT